MDRELELRCAGKQVSMNRFAKAVVLSTVLGLLKALKGIDEKAELILRIEAVKK
jgi:hypothetical protein